jgi:HlyD family secretion protein
MTITIGALPNISPNAIIEYIAPKATESNGANSFELKAAVTMPDTVALRAGYSANASVMLQSAPHVLTVPESVVEFSGDSTFVYVLTDSIPSQKFERRSIKTGISDGVLLQVLSGIDKNVQLRGTVIN